MSCSVGRVQADVKTTTKRAAESQCLPDDGCESQGIKPESDVRRQIICELVMSGIPHNIKLLVTKHRLICEDVCPLPYQRSQAREQRCGCPRILPPETIDSETKVYPPGGADKSEDLKHSKNH